MTLFRWMFDWRSKEALDAEVAGDLAKAAILWAEMGSPEKAAELMVRHGERQSKVEDRVGAWIEALRFLREESEDRRAELEAKIGIAVLAAARSEGLASAESKRRLLDAAARLERAARWTEAADCYELLGRPDDLTRCLEKAGDIERLERMLDSAANADRTKARLRALSSEHDLAMAVGAREAARRAVREAVSLAPEDPSFAAMLRRIEDRWPRGKRLRLEVGGSRVGLIGSLPASLGRDADVTLRGGSVSRRHCEIDRRGHDVIVRDLESRNGTLVAGVPIAGEIVLTGPTEIGLGDDVVVRVSSARAAAGIDLEVIKGLDRGERIVLGEHELQVAGLRATFSFTGDRAVLTPAPGLAATLAPSAGQSAPPRPISAPIDLLIGDVITLDGVRVEVLS